MTSIHTLHWDEIPPCLNGAWAPASGRVFAVWPAPTNPDVCFSKAGFNDFEGYEGTAEWDAEFEGITEALMEVLSETGGAPVLREGARHVRATRWRERVAQALFRRQPRRPSAFDVLVATAHDDNLPDCTVQFGLEPNALLRTAHGHLIWWVWLSAAISLDIRDLLRRTVGERRLKQTTLNWELGPLEAHEDRNAI
ncbi:hypothetical protein [Polyangium sp. 15x6]|uniref:hypothetical protein n=1 Tax=Polyangium sp. 15x6 TaxID=3042687 RepID=UPI00249B56C1|nr:hypothetical protein [Polyangium sp. 15x6]MDI3290927.1 hypothetical protein [Polyangium sp. 15x6]